jgi:hypothetical protein
MVMAAVVDHGSELVEREDRIIDVHAMGVDETAFLRAGPTHPTMFAPGIADLHRGKLIDITNGRSHFRNYRLRLLLHCGMTW